MAAHAQIHAQDGVARGQQRRVHGHVGLRAGMGLHIGKFAAEQLFDPLDGQIFHLVHILAAAVKTRPGIPFRVLVGQMAAHGLHHGTAGKILRGDQFDMAALALKLPHEGNVKLGVLLFQYLIAHSRGPPIHISGDPCHML